MLPATLLLLLAATTVGAQERPEPVQLFMPDGQLISHPVKVFVTRQLTQDMEPRLRLSCNHLASEVLSGETEEQKPELIAPQQRWVQQVDGQKLEYTGTLLLFDLKNYPLPGYKATLRLTPALTWKESGTDRVAIGANEIYLGHAQGTVLWTFVAVMGVLVFITWLAYRFRGNPVLLLTGRDCRLSLWRTQIAAWTVAIGTMVTAFGLIRLEIPNIPDSLVALMGLSLVTGGIRYQTTKEDEERLAREGKVGTPGLRDLIVDHGETPDQDSLSIAKAQMVFWTVLLLVLFVTKSALDGALWDVPWQLVTLMGFSQASYVGPKVVAPAKQQAESR